jgi:hypothetical protein
VTQIRKHLPHLRLRLRCSLWVRCGVQCACRRTGSEPVTLRQSFEQGDEVGVNVRLGEQNHHLVDGFGSLQFQKK